MDTKLIVSAAVILCVGIILLVVGIATHEWSIVAADHSKVRYIVESSASDSVNAVLAMCIIGLVCGVVSLVLTIVQTRVDKEKAPKMAMGELIVGMIGVAVITIGMFVWGFAVHDPDTMCIGYSFALSCSGGLLFILGSTCGFMAERVNRNESGIET